MLLTRQVSGLLQHGRIVRLANLKYSSGWIRARPLTFGTGRVHPGPLIPTTQGLETTRSFSQSSYCCEVATGKETKTEGKEGRLIYMGPLAKTARYLKVFSVSSLSLTIGALPLIFLVDAELSMAFRMALAGGALFTSASSTFLIYYAMHPYVLRISLPEVSPPKASEKADDYQAVPLTPDTQLAITTLTFWAKPMVTYLPIKALRPSSRVFTSWKASGPQLGQSGKPLFIHPDLSQTPEMNQLVGMVNCSGEISNTQ